MRGAFGWYPRDIEFDPAPSRRTTVTLGAAARQQEPDFDGDPGLVALSVLAITEEGERDAVSRFATPVFREDCAGFRRACTAKRYTPNGDVNNFRLRTTNSKLQTD